MTYKLTPRKQQLASFYEAFKGNPDALDRILTPDWVSHEPNPDQGARQGLKNFIGLVRKSVPDVKASVEDMIEEGDRIAVRLTIAGTHGGPMLDVAATDKPFSVRAHGHSPLWRRWHGSGKLHIEGWLSFLFQGGAMK